MSDIRDAFNTAISSVVDVINDVIDWLRDIKNSLVDGFLDVVDWLRDIKNNLSDFFSDVGDWFANLFTKLGDWFQSVIDGITNLPDKLRELFEYLFIPKNADETGQAVMNALGNKFLFVENFKTALNNLNSTPVELAIPIEWGNYKTNLSLAWYEPYRARVKSGISTIFYISCAIAIFGLFSSAFGIGIGKYTSGAVKDESEGGKS